jgi:5-methylcytosine-specific restriction endonuclease McrA
MKKYNIDEKTLRDLYITKNMRRNEVAEYFGCSTNTIKKYVQKYKLQKSFELECKNKERKTLVKCLYCEIMFETQKFRTESEKYTSKYCSYSCSQKSRYLGEEHKKRIRNEIAARRRARQRNQTPVLSEDDKKKIQKFYLNCPKGYEVDHIVPLAKGGLHHPDNLQILSMTENRKKGSKNVS